MKKLLLIFSILIALLLTGCKNKTNDIAIIKFYTYNHMAYLVLNEHFLGKDTDRKDNFKTILFVFEHFYDYSECPKYFSSSAKDYLSSFRNLDWDMEIAYQKSKKLEKEMEKYSPSIYPIYLTLYHDFFMFREVPKILPLGDDMEMQNRFSKLDSHIQNCLEYSFKDRKINYSFLKQSSDNIPECISAFNKIVSLEYRRTGSMVLSPCFLYSVAILAGSYDLPKDFLSYFRGQIVKMIRTQDVKHQKNILEEINCCNQLSGKKK